MRQVQFTNETRKDEFTKGRIYETYTRYNGCHLAVKDDAGDEHLIASIRNEKGAFDGDSFLNENFVWGDAIKAETEIPSEKKLRIQHFPNVPCKAFTTPVKTLEEARTISNLLADYDRFQYENRIKPDYSNTTILQEYDETEGDWMDWCDEETGISNLNEYFEYLEECKNDVA